MTILLTCLYIFRFFFIGYKRRISVKKKTVVVVVDDDDDDNDNDDEDDDETFVDVNLIFFYPYLQNT